MIHKLIPKLKTVMSALSRTTGAKTWNKAQIYEFEAAKSFMESEYFSDLMIRNKELRNGKSNELNMEVFYNEFFNKDQEKLNDFIDNIRERNCLEIGPSCATLLGSWWFSRNNYIIEPLFSKIHYFQKK